MKQYSFLQEATPVGVGIGAATAGMGVLAASVSWKLANEIKKLKFQMMSVESREEAISLLRECTLYIDEITGKKTTKLFGVKNGMANLVVGPCMQIISNESNLNWKSDVVKFLNYCIISNRIQSIVFGTLGVGIGAATAVAL